MVPFPDRPGLHFCFSLTVSMGSIPVWMVRLPSYRTGCRNKMTAEQAVSGKRLQINRWETLIGLLLEETEGVLSNAP